MLRSEATGLSAAPTARKVNLGSVERGISLYLKPSLAAHFQILPFDPFILDRVSVSETRLTRLTVKTGEGPGLKYRRTVAWMLVRRQ